MYAPEDSIFDKCEDSIIYSSVIYTVHTKCNFIPYCIPSFYHYETNLDSSQDVPDWLGTKDPIPRLTHMVGV